MDWIKIIDEKFDFEICMVQFDIEMYGDSRINLKTYHYL